MVAAPLLPRILLSAVMLFLSLHPLVADDYAFPLEGTVAEAMEKANADDHPVFLEFMVRGCQHCERFRRNVLQSDAFAAYAKDHLHVVIYNITRQQDTPEQTAELKALMKAHRVQYTPTIVILSPEGKRLLRTEGYKGTPAEAIVANLKQLTKP